MDGGAEDGGENKWLLGCKSQGKSNCWGKNAMSKAGPIIVDVKALTLKKHNNKKEVTDNLI